MDINYSAVTLTHRRLYYLVKALMGVGPGA